MNQLRCLKPTETCGVNGFIISSVTTVQVFNLFRENPQTSFTSSCFSSPLQVFSLFVFYNLCGLNGQIQTGVGFYIKLWRLRTKTGTEQNYSLFRWISVSRPLLLCARPFYYFYFPGMFGSAVHCLHTACMYVWWRRCLICCSEVYLP